MVSGVHFRHNGDVHSRHRSLRSARPQPGRLALHAVVAVLALLGSLAVAAPANAVVDASASVAAAAPAAVDTAVDSGIVKAAAVVGFNPENIISDSLFYDGKAMTAAEIQSFLDAKIGSCRNGKCLNVLNVSVSSRDAWVSQATGNLVCSALQGGTMRVSELIYRIQVACGVSAKVILVTLQKEQGLTTSDAPSDWNLQAAMGASCPDTAPCDPAYSGVGPQIVQGVRQIKIYKAGRFAMQPGVNYIGYNPNSACGGTNLNIQNYATAALYNYTPYQPNAASLAAGWGLGDGCSSYGNRNFYNYYTSWFGSTQGDDTANSPIGALDVVTAAPGTFRVAGWAIDPNTSAPIAVHIYVGSVGTAVTADKLRPDVAAAYPSAGGVHGFDASVSAIGAGDTTVCVYGINVGLGANRLIGCKTVSAMSGSPVGNLDEFSVVDGGIAIRGWLIDPDTVSSTQVHVYVDGVGSIVTANGIRADLAPHYPAYGTAHGYSAKVRVAGGVHTVCVYGINVGPGSNTTFRCLTAVFNGVGADNVSPVGSVDVVSATGTSVTVKGWALDPDTVSPVAVHIYVGPTGTAFTSDKYRADIARAYPLYGASHGFSATVTGPAGTSDVCAYAIDTNGGANTLLGCKSVTLTEQSNAAPIGSLDAVVPSSGAVRVEGWAIDPDTIGPIAVHVYVDGVGRATTAGLSRPDVATVFPAFGPLHGFIVTVPASPGTHTVCAYGINSGVGDNALLGCREVTVP